MLLEIDFALKKKKAGRPPAKVLPLPPRPEPLKTKKKKDEHLTLSI
jgi:hypothetical protein